MTIQTFVFFDLETTGLPSRDNPAKITELTMICVSRRDLEKADGKTLPPVSKLSILFNPQKSINPYVVKLTGLTNKFLSNQPTFGDKVKCINSFLDAPKPVCLVAHNGDNFDYKIINNEYANVNAELPKDLLCVDSLKVFKKILNQDYHENCSTSSISNSSLDDSAWPDLDLTPEAWDEIDNLVDSMSQLTSTPKKSCKVSYKLENIYKMLLNKELKGAHRAEADCIMLLECAVATKHKFMSWADKNYKLLNIIKS